MGRPRKNAWTVLALSPSATALALGVPIRRVREALDTGELEALQDGPRVRIWIEDTTRWFKSWPKAKRKRRT
jgi:hypothetical protein